MTVDLFSHLPLLQQRCSNNAYFASSHDFTLCHVTFSFPLVGLSNDSIQHISNEDFLWYHEGSLLLDTQLCLCVSIIASNRWWRTRLSAIFKFCFIFKFRHVQHLNLYYLVLDSIYFTYFFKICHYLMKQQRTNFLVISIIMRLTFADIQNYLSMCIKTWTKD